MRTIYSSEQIAQLQKNPCVWHVSERTISYTYEFKKYALDLYAQGIKPNDPIVQGAVKTTEAFRALVRGYRAGLDKNFDETIRLAGDAWNLGAKAKELAPALSQIAGQVQQIAKGMADNARSQKAAQNTP